MENELFDYQVEGYGFLTARKHALLADEMGLGKTPQAIVSADGLAARRILVVCPAIARINWQREFDAFSFLSRSSSVIESEKFDDAEILISSYEMLNNKKVRNRVRSFNPDTVIIDESHYLKGRKSNRTKILLGQYCRGGGLIPENANAWFLSGTPAPNNPAELWPILHFSGVYPKGYWDYVREYCTGYEGPFNFKITGARNIPRLRKLIDPFMLRRKKIDVAKDLPSITFKDVFIPLKSLDYDDLQTFFRTLWQSDRTIRPQLQRQEAALRVLFESRPSPDDTVKALEAMAESMGTLRQWIGVAKCEAVAELIKQDIESGMENVVIFAHHRVVIRALSEYYLKDLKPGVLYGGTSPKRKQRMIDDFQARKLKVIICQIQAAGTAIDLTASHNVVFVEPDWVPGNNAQAAMRVHRHGQTRPVLVRFLAAANSIDEHIMKVFRKKAQTLTKIFD